MGRKCSVKAVAELCSGIGKIVTGLQESGIDNMLEALLGPKGQQEYSEILMIELHCSQSNGDLLYEKPS